MLALQFIEYTMNLCQKGHTLQDSAVPCITCACKDKYINLVRSVCDNKLGTTFTFETSMIKQIAGILSTNDGINVICYAKRPGKVDLSPNTIQITYTERASDVHRAIEAQANKLPELVRKRLTEASNAKKYKKTGALPFMPMYYSRMIELVGISIESDAVSADIIEEL